MTYSEVLGRKKKLLAEAAHTLTTSLETTLSRIPNADLPFEIKARSRRDRAELAPSSRRATAFPPPLPA